MSNADIISLIAIVFLLAFSGFFSGSETALTAASKARISRLAREGKTRAKRVARLIEDKESLIGSILLGNNLVNILASALATGLLISLVGEEGVALATIIMTTLVLIFAEVLPKTFAISNPDRVALFVSPVIEFFIKLFSPVVKVVQKIVNGTLKLFGVDITNADHAFSGHEEIRGHIDLQAEEGRIYKSHKDMLGSILDLDDLTVEEVMIHRKSMAMLNVDEPPAMLINKVVNSAFTRIPLWEKHSENIVGVLHARDVLKAVKKTGTDYSRVNIREIMTEPWFVPETTTLGEQLNAFLQRHSHFALVVDEYGALMGLITLEDILEEIVGDIKDEYDMTPKGVRRLKGGGLLVDGDVTIRDLNREMDWTLPDEEASTLAGFVIHLAEMIPYVGQIFEFGGLKFEIKQRKKNQITKIKITRLRRPKRRGRKPRS